MVSYIVLTTLLVLVMIPSYAFELNDVCSKTFNSSFCLLALSSNPQVTKSLLHSLAQVTIDLAQSNATDTRQQLTQWQKGTDNPVLRARYTSCSSSYNDAISDLKEAKEKVSSGDYNGVRVAATGVMGETNGCLENFRQPPADPSTLLERTRDLFNFSSIILVLSNILAQSY